MKELFRAKEIHQEIITLDKEIISLEKMLDLVIKEDLKVKSKARVIKPMKEEKKDDECSYSGITLFFPGSSSKPKKNWDFDKKLNTTEFVVMYAALLKYKQEHRIKLIQEFNKLSLKLKI